MEIYHFPYRNSTLALFYQRVWFFEPHKVDGIGGKGDEQNLHDKEVKRCPSKNDSDISGNVYCEVELLCSIAES